MGNLILITLCIALVSSGVTPAWGVEGKILGSDKEVKVPASLVSLLEDQFIELVRNEEPTDIRTDLQIKMEIPRELLSLRMQLKKRGGKSLEEDVEFLLPPGGGRIDLASYLRDGRGLFSFHIEMPEDLTEDDLERLRVFFIPRYHRQIHDNEARGLGCNQYVEITRFFENEIAGHGLLLTTTHHSYFPVIAGTFVFVITRLEGLKLASLTLLDSRFKNSLCPTPTKR